MSQLPVSEQTTFGYEAPSNTQFSVFLDNKVGKLLELVETFDGQALRLVALSVIDSKDHAVVRLVTSRAELARRLLTRKKFAFSETDILVVELAREQSLAKLCLSLLSAELNIHYAYPLMVRPHGAATIALSCDDLILAGQILLRKRFILLGENDLGENATGSDPGAASN